MSNDSERSYPTLDINNILETIQGISSNLNIPGTTNTFNINIYNNSTIYEHCPDNRKYDYLNENVSGNPNEEILNTDLADNNINRPINRPINRQDTAIDNENILNSNTGINTQNLTHITNNSTENTENISNNQISRNRILNLSSLGLEQNGTITRNSNQGNDISRPPGVFLNNLSSHIIPNTTVSYDPISTVYSIALPNSVNDSSISLELEGVPDTLHNSITDILNNIYTSAENNSVSLRTLNNLTNISLFSSIKEEINDEESIEHKCHICNVEYVDDDILRVNSICGHYFHQICLDQWFSSHNKCPICNQVLSDNNMANNPENNEEI